MNSGPLRFLSATVLLLFGSLLFAAPGLDGVFIVGADARFRLSESTTREASGWVKVGDSFAGYTVKEYRAASETLVLVRDGKELTLSLREPTIVDARIAVRGKIRLGPNQTLDVQNATLRWDEETTFPVAPGLMFTVKPARRPDGNILYRTRWEREKPDGSKETLAAPGVIARPGESFSARVDDLEFELKP